jgi:mono/diheme cytochrome c family protein
VLARAKGEAPSSNSPASGGGQRGDDASHPGVAIYAGACAQCHGEAGRHPLLRAVDLALSSTLRNPRPDNAIRIIRGGIEPLPGKPGPMMPPFADALTDRQLADLLSYLRGAFAEREPWNGTEDAVKRVKEFDMQETTAAQAAARTP